VAAFPYVAGPILIKFTQRMRAYPNLQPFDPDQEPPPGQVATYFAERVAELESVGFRVVNYVLLPDQIPNVTALFVLVENRESSDLGMAALMYGMQEGPGGKAIQMQNQHVEFSTEMIDGTEIDTNNSRIESGFSRVTHKRVFQFDPTLDAARLFYYHQRVVDEFGTAGKRPLPPTEELLNVVGQSMHKEMADQVPLGMLYLDGAREYFRMTWKGAILMTWKNLWPVTALRRAARARRARGLIERWTQQGLV
jgi:hypothetical protein